MPDTSQKGEKIFRGIPVSMGVCRGKIIVLGRSHAAVPKRVLTDAELPEEINRLERALIQTRQQIPGGAAQGGRGNGRGRERDF